MKIVRLCCGLIIMLGILMLIYSSINNDTTSMVLGSLIGGCATAILIDTFNKNKDS